MSEKIKIGKANIDNVTMAEAVEMIDAFIAEKKIFVVTPNLDHIVKLQTDTEFTACYNSAGLVLPDGNPLVWASKILKTPLKSVVPGSDLFPQLCKMAAQKGYRVFFLGGLEGVAAKAADVLQKKNPGLNIVGTYCPPFGFENNEPENQKIIHLINAAQPHLLFVGVGAPKQEKWMHKNINSLHINVALGIGASFDFEAGAIKRAPMWMRGLGLEWFWRFLNEPRRLFRRYFIDSLQFMPIIYSQWKKNKKMFSNIR